MLSPKHVHPEDEAPGLQGIKRKRKAFACIQCRMRKLKCDLERPACSRCARVRQHCTYEDDQGHERAQSATASQQPNASQWRGLPVTRLINKTANRSLDSEASVSHTQTIADLPRIQQDTIVFSGYSHDPPPSESLLVRGVNFKTQFHGSTNSTSLIAHFPELRTFMKQAITSHSSLPRVQRDLKALQVQWKNEKANMSFEIIELISLMPPKEDADRLIGVYFASIEATFRIVHRPSFFKEYKLFGEDRQSANPSFLVLMFLMMAASACLSTYTDPSYIGDSSIARERAVLWIEISEWWLNRQSNKHIYLAIWQIRILLVLAKQINVVKKKQHWTLAGGLFRQAMAAGFHRDARLLGEKASAFDAELRRRLWGTIQELELQASIDRGMPSSSAAISSDCCPVLNSDDDDMEVACDTLPKPKPSQESTDSSYLHLSRSSFSLRVSLNSLANDSTMDYEDVLTYEDMINKEIQKVEAVRGLQPLTRALLHVELLQFLILIHAPFARRAESNSRWALSRIVCFHAAGKIIETYSDLSRAGTYMLLLLRHDYFRSALMLCHNSKVSLSLKDDIFSKANSSALVQRVESALILLEERVARLGTGYTHFWYISAGLSLVKAELQPITSTAEKLDSIERVARQYYRVLANQESFKQAKQKLLIAHEQVETAINPLQASSLDALLEQPLEEYYFGDPAAWTFEGLGFEDNFPLLEES